MKRILKKVLVIILVILMLNNLFIAPVHAMDQLGSFIGGLFSGIIGILTITYRVPAVMIGWLVNKFMVALAFAEGYTDPAYAPGGVVDHVTNFLTIFDVLFDRVKLLSIDFFDIVDGDTSLVNQFRINVAAWFYIMRNVAAGILLVILIYIGIRMAISTIASDRAMYKRMLVDWAASLLLIFVLNYVIIFTISVNKAIVSAMAGALDSTSGSTSVKLEAVMGKFGWKGMNPFGGISSIVTAVIYVMLIWQTAAIFFSYFNRMLKIAFLIIISPLISLTYSIDKIGDGKAQALDSWLKEFVFTVLIQPFHCAIYMCLISTSINVLIGLGGFNHISQTIGSAILSLVCITFTKEAEKIVRKIFAFQDDNKSTSLVAGAAMASFAMNKAKSFGTGSVKAFNGAKEFFKDGKNSLAPTNIRAEYRAAKAYLSKDNNSENGEKKDYATLRSEKRAELYEEKANKLEKRFREAQKGRNDTEKIVAEARRMQNIETERQKIEDSLDGTMDSRELNAIARFNAAKNLGSGDGKSKEKNNTSSSGAGKSKDNSNSKASTQQDTKTTGDKGSEDSANEPSSDKPKLFSNLRDVAKKDIKNFSMQETLQKSITRGSALFMGSGTYGVRGRVSEAIGAGVATYTAVNSMMKGSKCAYRRDIRKLVNGHSDSDDKDKIGAILRGVSSNSEDYDLSGDKIPDKLKDIINELKSEVEGGMPDESDIVNTITSNTENPAGAIESLFADKLKKGSKATEKDGALTKLQNYGIEYAISQKMSSANEVGVRPSQIITSIVGKDEISDIYEAREYLEGKGENSGAIARRNLQLSKDFIANQNISAEVNAVAPNQLEGVYKELGEIIKKREALLQTLPDNTELKNKTEELEIKRTELIKSAVQEIDVRNNVELEILQTKISKAANKVIEQFNNSEGTEEDRKNSIKALESLLGDLK